MKKYEGLMIGGPKARQSLAATSTTIRFPERPDSAPLSRSPENPQPIKEHVYKFHEPIPGIPFWVYQNGNTEEASLADALIDLLRCYSQPSPANTPAHFRYRIGQRLRKKSGAEWYGRVVGWYSTSQTPEGYNIESAAHPGSTQLWPLAALEPYVDED